MSEIARIPVTKFVVRIISSGWLKLGITPSGGGTEPTVADILAKWLKRTLTLPYIIKTSNISRIITRWGWRFRHQTQMQRGSTSNEWKVQRPLMEQPITWADGKLNPYQSSTRFENVDASTDNSSLWLQNSNSRFWILECLKKLNYPGLRNNPWLPFVASPLGRCLTRGRS